MSISANDRPDGIYVKANRILAWWLGELRSTFDDLVRQIATITSNSLTIEAGEFRWLIRRKREIVGEIDWENAGASAGRQQLRELAGAGRRPMVLLVELPPERILRTVISLPAAAQRELARILPFEVARHFPFAAERILYCYRVIGGSAETAAGLPALSIEVVAVPREIVVSILEALTAAGLRAGYIGLVAAPGAAPLFLNVDSSTTLVPPRADRWFAASAVAALALAAAISWPVEQQFRLAAIQREIAAVRPAAEATLRLRERLQQAVEKASAGLALRAGRPPVIAILDRLSRDLPDGSWLTSLSIAGHSVVIEGLSPSAATIALAFGRDPQFAGIVFRSPITRDAASGLEHFQFGITVGETKR